MRSSANGPARILEKAAVDNGWDLELPRESEWLAFAGTQAPLRIWITTFQEALFLAAFSQHVARSLGEYGTPLSSPLPPGAVAGRTVTDFASLGRSTGRHVGCSGSKRR